MDKLLIRPDICY